MANARRQLRERFENIVKRKHPPEGLPSAIRVYRKKYSINDAQVDRLREATSSFLSHRQVFDRWPRPAKIKADLKSVIEFGGLFLNALRNLDHPTQSRLFLARAGRVGEVDSEALRKVQHAVVRIMESCEDALKSLPLDRGGRPAKPSLGLYIENLALIYGEVTGKKPTVAWSDIKKKYRGPFLVFVNDCLKTCDQPPSSNKSLGKAIQRTLKDLKAKPPTQP